MKKIINWIIFGIIYGLISLLLLFYLDLANGPEALLYIEIVVIACGIVLRILFRERKFGFRFLAFALLIGLNIPILLLAHPRYETFYPVKNIKETEVMELKNGKVIGTYNEDETVRIYAGVPYAKPPIGELRFREPMDVEDWVDVMKCVKFAPRAMQVDRPAFFNSLVDMYAMGGWHPNYKMQPLQEMSEDCLYLNIFRPNNNETNLPIVMYIHGGSLSSGSSASYDINGERYAKEGVIMITIGYRLNVFGYLALQDLKDESPNHTTGNYGLLDQIKALQWINDNAAYFGGDKNNITIAGESAGSSSVSAICSSPLAKGLFQKAIGESSSLVISEAPHTFRTLEQAYETGKNILNEFNCKTIDDLRNIDSRELVKTKFSNTDMTVDGYALPKTPYQTYLDKENNEVALLNGYNIKEADAFVIPSFLFTKITSKNIKDILSNYLNEETATKLLELYKDEIEVDAKKVLCEIISVYWFIYPHHSWTNMAINNNEKVYRYHFTKENGYYGTYHSGEIIYAYGNISNSIFKFAYNETDKKLENIMVKYFTNFIKTGNPNGEGLPKWDEYNKESNYVMELGEEVKMIPDRYYNVYSIIKDFIEGK